MKNLLFILLFLPAIAPAQRNLLLNGGFEDVNTCTEYNSECGVEGWFYLKDVKAQMLSNGTGIKMLGDNSFGLSFVWLGYTDFAPLIGTILPCALKRNKQYTFRGVISAKLNPKLKFKLGLCTGEWFYVPRRSFAKQLIPDSITSLKVIPNTNLYQFEYHFTASGDETYLTFGTYVFEDTTWFKAKLTGTQTVSIVLDNFQLLPRDENENPCNNYLIHKERIYNYNYRHKEMDYSLYGKGELPIAFNKKDTNLITQIKEPEPIIIRDTLKLGDVLFDYNKATLKQEATHILAGYFLSSASNNILIDSIYIEGHTDSIGSEKRNMELSQQRCEAVKNWVVLNSVTLGQKLFIHPFGKSKPITSNSTAEGRALNRRVELVIFRRKEK